MTIIRENCGWTFKHLPELMNRENIIANMTLHVGCHKAQEVPVYRECGFKRIILVEANPELVQMLCEKYDADYPEIEIVPVAVSTEQGTATFYLQDRDDWSGLNESAARAPGLTLGVELGPSRAVQVDVETLPALQALYPANVLILDVQGLEMTLLRTADLAPLDLVIVETSHRPGDSAAPYSAAVQFMSEQGWEVSEVWQQDDFSGYFDTAFVKTHKE